MNQLAWKSERQRIERQRNPERTYKPDVQWSGERERMGVRTTTEVRGIRELFIIGVKEE